MSNTLEVGKQLVELCKQGKNLEAIDQLYAKKIVSVEAAPMPGMGRKQKGRKAVHGKNVWWLDNHEVHGGEVDGPYPHGKRHFAVKFSHDVTNKQSGQRTQMQEIAVYKVNKKGKICRERFYYSE